MSQSHLVQTIASVVRRTNRGASDVTVARAIVTSLSAAGYEIVRTRPGAAVAASDSDARANADTPVEAPVEPPQVVERRRRRAG